MGGPKALQRRADGVPWLAHASAVLRAAGCERVLVVLGAAADDARALVPAGDEVVVAEDWAEGMSASIRAGLAAASGAAVLLTLVDLPELPDAVARRVVAAGYGPDSLRQAAFDGRPGHPVLIGREHWGALAAELRGDRGARGYLLAHGAQEIECGDLFDGGDVDR